MTANHEELKTKYAKLSSELALDNVSSAKDSEDCSFTTLPATCYIASTAPNSKGHGKDCEGRSHVSDILQEGAGKSNSDPSSSLSAIADSVQLGISAKMSAPSSHHQLSGTIAANETSPVKEFDAVILSFMEEQKIPGASLALWRKGEMLYTQCYGWAKSGVQLKPHHRFRIASVTKSVTAAAIMLLVEKKKVSLQDKVFGPKGLLPQYSPTVEGDRRLLKVTVKHLLHHSGGWDREVVGDAVFWKHIGAAMGVQEPVGPPTIIKYMMTQKLQFTPGSRYAYSNLGYLVLGRVIETVTEMSYESFIVDMLEGVGISGVKLGRTKLHQAESDEVEYFPAPRHLSVDSVYPDDGKVPGPYGGFCMESGDSDGGLIATPTNMVRFFNALDGSGPVRLLQPKSLKTMLERPSHAKGSAWYGMGLDVTWYRKAWEHSGTLDGATSCLVHDRHGYTWCFLCNYWPEDSDYTSLISYAVTRVQSWTRLKTVTLPPADAVTLDKMHLVKLKVPECQFNTYNNTFVAMGYQLSWVNGYEVSCRTFLNGIWVKNDQQYVSHVGINKERCDQCLLEMSAAMAGYRLTHIDTYISHENCQQLNYSLIFIKETGPPWLCFSELTLLELDKKTSELKELGFAISQQSVTCVAGKVVVCALYVKNDCGSSWSWHGLSLQRYQGEFDKQSRYGHMLAYIKPYMMQPGMHQSSPQAVSLPAQHTECEDIDQPRVLQSNSQAVSLSAQYTEPWDTDNPSVSFSAIWTNPGPYVYISESEMSKYRLINDILFVSTKKFHPLCISGYEDEGSHRFVAVLVKKVPPASC